MKRETLEAVVADLRAGRTPSLTPEDVPAFSEAATAGDPHIGPAALAAIAAALTEADIPTFERALRALDEGDLAWLGFKVVYDAAAAVGNVDNEVTKKYGEVGSADGESLVFFCNDAKLFHFSYQRYLENQIRSTFGLEGTPLRLTIRQKGEKEG